MPDDATALQQIRDQLIRMNQGDNEARREMLGAIEKVDRRVTALVTDIESKFVRKEYFDAVMFPIKAIVYGLAGLILTGVVGGLLALVLKASQ